MEDKQPLQKITEEAIVKAPVEKVWKLWNEPEHIVKWSHASDDWHTTRAENNLVVGGTFSSRMEAKDGSFGFDFGGVYDEVKTHQVIAYTMADERTVSIFFTDLNGKTKIVETFEAENTNPIEMQQGGWQAILNSFKKYTENMG
jgi:uncharacterized protein YndB with AHSA1/START domain